MAHTPTVGHRGCRDRNSSAPPRAGYGVTATAVDHLLICRLKGRPIRGAGASRSSDAGRVSSSDCVVHTHPSHYANSSDPPPSEVAPEKGAQARTVWSLKGPALSGVSLKKGAQNRTVSAQNGPEVSGVSLGNTAQTRTVSDGIPAQTPPPNARAGRNPRTKEPLTP